MTEPTSSPQPDPVPDSRHAPLREAVGRHPVLVFLALVFAITALIQAVPAPEPVRAALVNILGSAVPAFVVTALIAGRDGLLGLARRSLHWRVPARWYAVVLLGPPVALLVVAPFLYGTAPLRALAENWPSAFTSFLPLLVVMVVFFNVAEEIGWTGFLFARLQERHRPLAAALLAFVPFWCWHVQVFARDTGAWLTGLLLAGVFALPHLASRVMTGWLYNSSGDSVLIAGMFHATFNATVNPSGFGAAVLGLPPEELPYVVGGLVVLAAVAVGVATRGRLGRRSTASDAPAV
jgi:uncharacterized protein